MRPASIRMYCDDLEKIELSIVKKRFDKAKIKNFPVRGDIVHLSGLSQTNTVEPFMRGQSL